MSPLAGQFVEVRIAIAPFLRLFFSNASKFVQLNGDFFLYLFVHKTKSRLLMQGPAESVQRGRSSVFLTLKSGAPQGAYGFDSRPRHWRREVSGRTFWRGCALSVQSCRGLCP